MKVDPITLEVIRGALTYISEEMGIALKNSAYSPNIRERMDHSCAIFDNDTRLVAQAEHIPVHLGSMRLAVQQGLEHYEGCLGEGDQILFNDPYVSGTHLPDLTLIAPVFHERKLVGYVANKAHHSDVGGKVPGSLPGDATELFQEGLIVPPIRLVKNGVIDAGLVTLILSNVRTPRVSMGDLRAQVAANNLGIARIVELLKEQGKETFSAATGQLMEYSEGRVRAEIEKMPDGVYRAEDWLEDTGIGNRRVGIKVQVVIEGSDIVFDYSETAPQVEGPLNAPLGVTVAGVHYTLACLTDPAIPINDGCYRSVEVRVPEGTLLNPIRPAPVGGGNVETSQRNVDVLLRAFSQICPERVCAAGQGTMNNICIGGVDPNPWTFYETVGGGYGARPGLDGVDGVHVHMTNTMNTPIEALEAQYPLRFLKYELRKDSGGPGEWRGGCGIERRLMLLASSATLSVLAERHKIPPWGLNGGKPGARGEFFVLKPDGKLSRLRSKCTRRMTKGDVIVIKTPGGGGYGHPFRRDPELVLRDVVNGLVSRESAGNEYGVAITDFKVDRRATDRLRADAALSEDEIRKELAKEVENVRKKGI